ncbi:hypothetical protein [Microbacterium elymi]|uniref:Uncharacterized protein n=1 Tax=Microbacterium elymi TaxID=2909587 RepID=A0ABY5NM88_9MICO|nr:hypothetical protein [Microbacterium elymi]UUT36297.1 hypothetical protein L2X98_25370 [Microbacterium elymi]
MRIQPAEGIGCCDQVALHQVLREFVDAVGEFGDGHGEASSGGHGGAGHRRGAGGWEGCRTRHFPDLELTEGQCVAEAAPGRG